MVSSIRLLLVEPNPLDRRLIRAALRGRQTRVIVVEASRLLDIPVCLHARRFDAALVDVDSWPQPFEAFDRIRDLAPDLPLAVVSRGNPAIASEAARRGVDGFVVKTEGDLARLHSIVLGMIERAAERAQHQASKQRFRQLLDTVDHALFVCDASGKILEASRSAEQLLDRSASDLAGTPLRRWIKGSSRLSLPDLVDSGPVRLTLRRESIPVEALANRLTYDDPPTYTVALRDMSRADRAGQVLRAFVAASTAMQGGLTPLDVFRAAGEQLRSVGLLLTVLRYLEDENCLITLHTEIAQRVLVQTQRLTGIDPITYRIPVGGSPILQSILTSDVPQVVLNATQAIREMLPRRLKRLAGPLQKLVGYTEQFGLRLTLGGRVYGLILVGYAEGRLMVDDQPMIEAFAAQIQAALERAQQFEATQSRLTAKLNELTQLVQVSEQMQLRLSLDQVLDTICGAIYNSLGWGRVIAWLRDGPTTALRARATRGAPAAGRRRTPDLNDMAWRQGEYRIGRSYFVPRNGAAAPAWQPGDMLVVPIEIGQDVLGAIQVDQPASGERPTPEELLSLELFAHQAAIAVENALLYERASARLQQRTDELTALTSLSAAADQGDMRASLERALDQVLRISGMEMGAVMLLDRATGSLRPYVRRGLPDALWEAAQHTPIHVGEGVGGRALAARRPIVVSDVATDPRVPFRDVQLREGIRTIIGIGLAGRNPVGSMLLLARMARRLSDETLDWLAVAGRQVALGIENTRLIESMRRRQQMAEAVREVSAAVASNLDLDAVLTAILDQVGRVIAYDTTYILQLEPDALHVIASRGLDAPAGALGQTYPRDERNPAWRVVVSRQTQVAVGVKGVDGWVGTLEAGDVESWIGTPLIVHDAVIGVLALNHRQPDFYTEADARNVSLIAQQAAVAIDNARRFRLERERTERLSLVNDLGRELIITLDRDAILSRATEYLTARFGYLQVDAFLVDPMSKELIWHSQSGSDLAGPDDLSRYRLATGVGISGRAVAIGKTYVSGDVNADPHYIRNPMGRNTRSEIAVPLRIEERVVGVLNVESDRADAFDADSTALLETFAGQVSAALSIAELYHETQQRAHKLSTLFAASQEFGSSLDSDQVLGRLAQWMVGAVDATSARVHTWDLAGGQGRLMAQYVGARAGAVERQSMVGATQPLDDMVGLVAAMQAREAAIYPADDGRVDPALRESLRARGVSGALYLPLVVRERLIGCVEVWETSRPRNWQPDEIYLCQTIANVAASAIDNAHLFEIERRRRLAAETLRELTAVVSSSLELQPILEALLERAAELIPYDSASVLIRELDGLRVAASRGLPEAFGSPTLRLPTNHLTETLLAAQPSMIVDDVRTLSDWTTVSDTEAISGWLGASLRVKGRVIGLLTFDSYMPGRYRREHAELAETIALHAAVAIENAQLYQETRQRLLELETLRVVSLEVIQSLDVRRVAQAIANGALRLLKATAVHLFSFDAAADTLQMIAKSAAPGYEMVGQPTPRRDGLTMQVAHRGHAVVVNAPGDDPRFAPITRATAEQGAKAILGLPLQVRGRVLGVMNVLFHVPHAIDDNEVRSVSLLADQAATALENARLFEDEQERRVAADVLREMSAVLTSTLNLNEVYERLFDQIGRVIPYTSTAVLLLEGTHQLRTIAGRGFKFPDRVIGTTLDLAGHNQVGRVVHERRLLRVADVTALDDWQILPGLEDVHSWMGAPLIARDEIIGTLVVDHVQPGMYRPEQADLFGAIANQAAAAIANGRLYEQALERERFASALGRSGLAITSSLELNAVLDQICRESAEAFGVDCGLVWLAEGEEMVGFAGYGVGREAFIGVRTRLDDTMTLGARVLQYRRGEFTNYAEASDHINQPLLSRLGLKALLGVPMTKGNTPIGTLVIGDSTRVDRFTAADIERAEVLATHAAIAIDNARLFQAERRRAQELALLNRVGLEVTSILDLDQLAQRVVEQIHGAFGYYHVAMVTIEDGVITWRAGTGGDVPGWTPAGIKRQVEVGIVGAAAGGEVVLVRNVQSDLRFVTVPELSRAQSEVALPLKAKGIVIGVLDVQSDRVNGFSDEDIHMLQALATQLSVAAENAMLYQALSQYATSLETRVAERTVEIRREQERTIAILNSVTDAVLVTDLKGMIVLTNPTADGLLSADDQGESPGRLQRWLHELTPESGTPKIDAVDRTLQAAVGYVREGERKVGHVIVLRDITPLEEVDRLKTQFVGTVSHELRTPLTNIKLYLGLFEKGRPEKREQYLATLSSEVSRLERLISDLLDLSRLERGRPAVVHTPIDLVEVLQHVASTLEPQAEAKQQTLRLELLESALTLPADRNQMIQVFVNLVVNAINYTPPRGWIALRAETIERDGQGWVMVSVSDNGVGIPVEDLDRIFDRFYRGQAEHFAVSGTGLGLAIVHEIVRQHAGEIRVDSQIGQGATFRVSLPMGNIPG